MAKSTQTFLLVLAQVLLALLLWVVFPRGYYPARRLWVDIHKWSGLALGILVLLHLALHWNWLVRMAHRYLNPRRYLSKRDRQGQNGKCAKPTT